MMETIKVMDRQTGGELDGYDSLKQRLSDCLSFPKGSLVGRRNYGADVVELLDRNVTPTFAMDAFIAISEALAEPDNGLTDFALEQVGITAAGENWVEFVVAGVWIPDGKSVVIEGVKVGGN